jgi:poly(beta-D-mannuronate) lyase
MKHLLFIALSFITSSAFATDHLVNSPEEAITFLNKAVAGDRVILKDGVYKDALLQFRNANGTQDKQVWFMAQTPGKVFFEGNSTLSFGGNYITVSGFVWQKGGNDLQEHSVINFKAGSEEALHCTVQDCAIDDYNNSNLTIDNKWISLFGQHNTLTRCLLKSKRNLGATVTVWLKDGLAARHLISYNYFLNRVNGPDADNGLESIRIGDSKTSFTEAHCIVAFNRFEDCDGEIEIISNKSCHNSYLHNTFVNSDGGLTLRHGNNCLCDGNCFDGGNKKLSYGIRFIGEGHTAINNYFYNLHGAPNETFRAPLTIVNGLENTPINGYFQVRRAVVSNNVFVNCDMPAIRMGAFSKRPGMTIAPDTITISNNILFDDAGKKGAVYESLTAANHLTINGNKIFGKLLQASEKGFEESKNKATRKSFDAIQDDKGNSILSIKDKATSNTTAGADWSDPVITAATQKIKYTYIDIVHVGPSWK